MWLKAFCQICQMFVFLTYSVRPTESDLTPLILKSKSYIRKPCGLWISCRYFLYLDIKPLKCRNISSETFWPPTTSNFTLSQKTAENQHLLMWTQNRKTHYRTAEDADARHPWRKTQITSSSGGALPRHCFDLLSRRLHPFWPFFCCGEAWQGSAGVTLRGLMPSNPLITPAEFPSRTIFHRAPPGRFHPMRLVCIKWTHVVFVLRSAADTKP